MRELNLNLDPARCITDETQGVFSNIVAYEGEVFGGAFNGLVVGNFDHLEDAQDWLAGEDNVNWSVKAAAPGMWAA